jgi:hypothetical protein
MKLLTILVCAWLLSFAAYSQVTGRLTDDKGNPLSFASVALIRTADSTLLRSASSNDSGAFRLSAAPRGHYLLKVTCLGYASYLSAPFGLDTAYDAGTIALRVAGRQLNEVVIGSSRPLVEQATGGLVVNPQSSIMTKGSTVLEVLARSPGVIVDPQTNAISLNGKSGVMVMLDGKLLRLSADQLATLLNGKRGEDIDKIELLTTPPAKYDADGNAGLINIVTKRNKKAGTSGSVSASAGYGKGGKAYAGAQLNDNRGKISLHGEYSYSQAKSYSFLLAQGSNDNTILGGPSRFHYNGESNPAYDYQGFSAGMDYRAGNNTTIGGSIEYDNTTEHNNSHNFGDYALPDTSLAYDSQLSGTNHIHYLHPNFYLEKTINKTQKLTVNLDYFRNRTDHPTQVQSNFSNSLFAATQRNHATANIQVSILQADYTNTLSKKLQLETGLKATGTHSQSNSAIENLLNGTWVPASAGTSNDLTTLERIGAAYAVLNWNPDSLTSLSAGTRYEYSSNTTGHSSNAQYDVDRKLGKLFPDIFLSRKLNTADQLQISYTERITRPSFADLASYVAYNDPTSVFTGNPALKPTVTHNFKLAYNKGDYLFSVLYSHDTNPIKGVQGVPGPTPGLVYLMPENADWQNNLTAQVNILIKIAAWWQMNYNFTGGWHRYRISYFPALLLHSYFSYSINFTESFPLPKNYAVELSGYYNSASYDGNNRNYSDAVVNLGIKKGDFRLSVADLSGSGNYRGFAGALITDAFATRVNIDYRPESYFRPIIKLSYSHSFGSGGKAAPYKNGTKAEQDRL